MKIKPKGALISIAIIGLVLVIVLGTLESTGVYGIKLLALPGVTNTDIILHFKTTTNVLDQNGRSIASDDSPFYSASPTFELVTTGPSPIEARDFVHLVSVRANTGINSVEPGNYRECLEQPENPELCDAFNAGTLVIKPSLITLQVFSKDSRNNLVNTHTESIFTNEIKLTEGAEQPLCNITCFRVAVENILNNLDPGTYNSLQEFRVSGNFEMHYEGFDFPATTYEVSLPTTKVPTFITMKVTDNNSGTDNPQTTDDQSEQNPGQDDDKVREITEIEELGEEFLACAGNLDIECLDQVKFGLFYAIIISVGGIVVIGYFNKQKGIVVASS